jgi:hypothetical protein
LVADPVGGYPAGAGYLESLLDQPQRRHKLPAGAVSSGQCTLLLLRPIPKFKAVLQQPFAGLAGVVAVNPDADRVPDPEVLTVR